MITKYFSVLLLSFFIACPLKAENFNAYIENIVELKLPFFSNITAISPMGDNLIYGDSDNHRIYITKNDVVLKSFGKLSKAKDGIENVYAITNDGKNTIYISARSDSIAMFDYEGKYVSSIPTPPHQSPNILKYYNGILYTASPHVRDNLIIYKNNKLYKSFAHNAMDDAPLKYDDGSFLGFDVSEKGLFFAFPLSYPIFHYDFEGNLIKKIGADVEFKNSYKSVDASNFQAAPRELFYAYDKINYLTVVGNDIIVFHAEKGNTWKIYVDIFDTMGNLLKKHLDSPYSLIIARQNNTIYLCDNNKLYRAKYKGVAKND